MFQPGNFTGWGSEGVKPSERTKRLERERETERDRERAESERTNEFFINRELLS